MALLAEEVVQEWLNRQGFFTIRGIKLGVHEIDILAIRPHSNGQHDCRHIEIQISTNPISYISPVPKAIQKTRGIGPAHAGKRTTDEVNQGIREWINKKFNQPKKASLRERLFPGPWTRELVVNTVKYPVELELFKRAGITILHLNDIVRSMVEDKTIIDAAAGADLFTLMQLGVAQATQADRPLT
jgi:hypothetical protein